MLKSGLKHQVLSRFFLSRNFTRQDFKSPFLIYFSKNKKNKLSNFTLFSNANLQKISFLAKARNYMKGQKYSRLDYLPLRFYQKDQKHA